MPGLARLALHAREVRAQGQTVAIATVVDAEGSVYRRPGARMLVRRDGATVGSVSGGCLEADLRERARVTLATGVPQVVTYDGADADAPWALGLGCNGRVTVLVQRLPRARGHWLEFVRTRHERRRALALLTMFRAAPDGSLAAGDSLAVDDCGSRHGRVPPPTHAPALEALLGEALHRRRTFVARDFAGRGSAALAEYLPPPVRLVVCGAGFDAGPVVSGARALHWETCVVDHRPAYLDAPVFDGAERRLGEPSETLAAIPGDARTAALVMGHHLERDRRALRALAGAELGYLGVLGPAARTAAMLEELTRDGVRIRAAERGRLYAPVGLALGAETAEEIAVAILAEIVGVFRGGAMQSLREHPGAIHALASGGEPRVEPTFGATG